MNRTAKQNTAVRNKALSEGEIRERYRLFEKRFIDEVIRGTDQSLPVESFYPTQDFQDVISEITNQLPSNFNIVGKESDFLRKSLTEGSYLKELLSTVYKEGVLSGSAFVLIKPKMSTLKDVLMVTQLEVLPFENCFPTYDIITGDLEQLVYQEKRVYMDVDTPVNFVYTVVYTKDTITTLIRNMSGNRIPNMQDNVIRDNPFKELGTLPIVEFRCSSKRGQPYASKLIEPQMQLDNLNTNIENLTNMHTNPIYVVSKTRRNWDDFPIGSGQILTLQDNEEFEIVKSDMQLLPLAARYNKKKDELYKSGGLVPPSLREEMYGTDSSKVVKIASGELIGFARILMNNFKKPLLTIAEIVLDLNGKELTDEVISPPNEILPYDLETVFSFMAVGLNIGLVDEEWFWDKYMPELSREQRDRITKTFRDKQQAGLVDESSINLDNNAKSTASVSSSPMGNKEQANTSKEDKDGKVVKA